MSMRISSTTADVKKCRRTPRDVPLVSYGVAADREGEPDSEDDRADRTDADYYVANFDNRLHADGSLRGIRSPHCHGEDPEEDDPADVGEGAEHVERQDPGVEAHARIL